MCGICGVLNLNSKPVSAQVVEKMAETIRHRGPDQNGVYTDGKVGLGHRRLSIIDVACGQQPMPNADKSLWISFNGEIFNYVELREDLERRGHRFRTRSDTEVILHLYEEHGEECVQHFNGQWAFAIWDRKKDRLFLSRDRLGVRPLFYTLNNETFIFGSEIKAILACPEVRRELDLIGLDQIFTFWCTRAPRTIFRNILELPPGHSLLVEAGRIRTWPYWQLDYPQQNEKLSEKDWAERLLELLMDATRIRLRSDVPVGAYLSGGLDSTVVTAIIRRHSEARLKTFSVVFEDPEFDERRYQREAVDFLRTEHHEVGITGEDIARVFPKVIWHAEKPVLRSAPAPLFLLSSLVRNQGYKVVLSGEGADEILGGYDIFKEAKIRRFWGRRLESRFRPLLLKRLYPYLGNLRSQSQSYLKAFFHVGAEDLANPLFSHLPRWELTSRIKGFFSEDLRTELRGYSALEELASSLPAAFASWDDFTKSQYLEASCLFPGYILSSQGDRMGMAHSVEGRFPFLDHRVVELAMQIPPQLKMKVLSEKHILKRATTELVPAAVTSRSKQPYRAPDSASFFSRGKASEPYVEEMLASARIRHEGVFNPTKVGKLYDKIKRGGVIGVKDNMALLGILSTQLVISQFIGNQ
jgi:asparagine synthase (glutamine-hydrolysing)